MTMTALSSTGNFPQDVAIQCLIDGNDCGSGTATFPGPTGTPYTVSSQTPWTATVGTHTLNWQIDTTNDPNPSNNVGTLTFTVAPNTYNVYISLSGLPATLAAGLQVDGASQGTIGGAQNKTLSFPIGTQHTITVDQYINVTSTSRYYDLQNTWTVTATASHVFSYQLRYLLAEEVGILHNNEMTMFPYPHIGTTTVQWGAFTSATGGPLNIDVWYPVGTVVYPFQAPTIVYNPYPNGTRLVLVGWQLDGVNQTGLPAGASSASTITMNGPHTVIYMYALQYRLWVVSDYGNPQLPGNWNSSAGVPYYTTDQASNPTVVSSWYEKGTIATASVTSPVGFTIQTVFQYWSPGMVSNSALLGSSNNTSVRVDMEGPAELKAEWSTSYTLLYYEIAGGISAVAVVAVAIKYFGPGLHLSRPPPGGPGPVEEPVEEF
jgi:hypothetical protein